MWRTVILILLIIVPLFAYIKKSLTLSASLLAAAMIAISLSAGENYATFIIVSFLLISVVDKLCKKNNKKAEDDITLKTGARDIVQVFSNGGVSILFIIMWHITHHSIFLLCSTASLIESFGDSAASDVGIAFGGQAYDICKFRKLKSGLSGGVTVKGTLACLVGCIVMSFIAYFLGIANRGMDILILTISSFFGCILDSVLGSVIQRKNKCTKCGSITEKKIHCGENTEYYSGWKSVDNDLVNLMCNVFSSLFLLVLAVFR